MIELQDIFTQYEDEYRKKHSLTLYQEKVFFHTVFTVPDDLNSIIYQNKRVMYTILFKASAETMQELAQDKKYLGGQIGITSIIHTWGQNLMFHPHIHMIVPAGALTSLNKWKKSKDKFFIPVKVLSRKFRKVYP